MVKGNHMSLESTGIPGDLNPSPSSVMNCCILLSTSLSFVEPSVYWKKRLDSVISNHVQKLQGETNHLY